MNCEKCGSDCFVESVIFKPEFDHEGEVEREDDGQEIWGEYEVFVCVQRQHMMRKFARYISSDELPYQPDEG